MQNNRKMRKLGSRDEHGVSRQSILSAMDRFVCAVDNMNETVMVPSRLLDMAASCEDEMTSTSSSPAMSSLTSTTSVESSSSSSASSSSSDLFTFFNMLNAAKNELIWGPQGSMVVKRNDNNNDRSLSSMSSMGSSLQTNGPSSINSSTNRSRRLSIVSSMSLSDSEADTESLSESESGLEYDERSSSAARNFRHHLNGLYKALQQLTSTADVLTGRYQDEVGGAS